MGESLLQLGSSAQTQAGVKPVNEDAVAIFCPDSAYLQQVKGQVLIVADGISAAEAEGKPAPAPSVALFWNITRPRIPGRSAIAASRCYRPSICICTAGVMNLLMSTKAI